MKNLNNTAFSLLEILMAAIIFIITVAGVFATLNAVRTPVTTKENELTAVLFGKQVLETLRSQVASSTPPPNPYSATSALSPFYNTCVACTAFDLELGPHQVNSETMATYGLSWPNEQGSGQNLGGLQTPANVLSYTVSCADGSSCTSAETGHEVDLNITY